MNSDLIEEVQEYKSKCDFMDECTAKYQFDGCGWCYVEHLKDINKRKIIESKVFGNFQTAREIYYGGL